MKDLFSLNDDDKKVKIINAALDEFTKNTYDKASTNTIVEKAGVSKGTLFNYFKSKKKLYDYLNDMVYDYFFTSIVEGIDWQVTDLFDRLMQIAAIKFEILSKYPQLGDFAMTMYRGRPIEEVQAEVAARMPEFYHDIYRKNIDVSCFKDGVDLEKVVKMTNWVLTKAGEEMLARTPHVTPEIYLSYVEEFKSYMDMLKATFYKPTE